MQKKSPRKLKNFVIVKKYQFFYARLFLFVSITGLLGNLSFVLSAYFSSHLPDGMVRHNIFAEAYASFASHPVLLFGLLFISILQLILAFAVGLVASHRVFGPTISLQRHLGNLINGDYSSRVHLRREDHLHELADLLNALAEKLEKERQF